MLDKSQSIGHQIGDAQELWLTARLDEALDRDVHRNVRLDTSLQSVTKEADIVVGERTDPDVVIELKYLRRSKQARERAYQIMTAADLFRDAHDAQTIAILTGAFTSSAIELCAWKLDAVYTVDFDTVQRGLAQFGLDVDWDNDSQDRQDTVAESWQTAESLDQSDLGAAIFTHTDVVELLTDRLSS